MSVSPWMRPEYLPVGRTWLRFQIPGEDGQPNQTYQIRDLEDSHKEIAVEIMKDIYLRDEPLSKALFMLEHPDSTGQALDSWRFCMCQNMSLACFTEVDGIAHEIVGLDILYVLKENDKTFQYEDLEEFPRTAWSKMSSTVLTIKKKVNVHTLYKVDKYLTSLGMVVLPEYRGRKIGQRLLEARKPLCEAFNIKVSATVFTATAGQKIAAECGYELLLRYYYLGMLARGIDLSLCATHFAKFMAIRYQSEENQ